MAVAVGVSPSETLKRGELPSLANPPRVGPKTLANPKQTRAGKMGVQGGEAPMEGVWGVPLQPIVTPCEGGKRGANCLPLQTGPRVGPLASASP